MIWRPFLRWPGGMLAKTLCCLICGVSLTAPVVAQSAIGPPQTLDFKDIVGAGNPDVTGLEIGPWLFASQKFHTVSLSDAGLLGFADNGTPYIASVGGGLDYPITLERTDGRPFALVGFDAAEGFLDDVAAAEEGYISATALEIEAMMSSGFTVTLTYDLDGLRDGPDGVEDFQMLTMLSELQNVTSVTFTGLAGSRRDAGFALDNIVVAQVVPEPASATLGITGIGAILIVGRKRRQCTAK